MMGNEESSFEGLQGLWLQSQDSEHLWGVILQGEEEDGTCVFTRQPGSVAQRDLCRTGVEHLRLLRHPNILKFLSCELSHDYIAMVTEPVVPVSRVLEALCVEGLVMGWRGVTQGLIFLHDKAGISHNSLHSGCLYVSTVTSQWKIGGFEAASLHKKMDAKFLSVVASIRPPKCIPPEDKSPSSSSLRRVPCHARDIWAFGQLVLVLLEDTALEAHVSDTLFTYVQEEMLNTNPGLRPKASGVLEQPWMSNEVADISDFLSNLTVKTKSSKDKFFSDLGRRIHSLPPSVLAEHLVPLLVSPLVMAEPIPHHSLWKHLLTPVSHALPRRKTFDPTLICPLLPKDLYVAHVLPLLLNLLECRETHIRLVLLEHVANYAPICPQQELTDIVLPEVLLGLQDPQDEMVQATLRALADLVPLLGAEVVMGTSRKAMFADTKPRQANAVPLHPPTGSVPAPHPPAVRAPLSSTTRQERAEKMREKREQQKRKRETAQAKLGKVADGSDLPLLGGDREEEEEEEEGGSGSECAPPTSDHPQYSPSVSHDEESSNNSADLNTLVNKTESVKRSSDVMGLQSPHALRMGGQSEEEEEEEWEGSEEKEMGWGSSWGASGQQAGTGGRPKSSAVLSAKGKGGVMKLKHSTGKEPRSSVSSSGSTSTDKSPGHTQGVKDSGSELKGRLSAEDIQRLEEQASWLKEPDFFADMEPSIMKHTSVESQRSPAGSSSQRSLASSSSLRSPASSKSQLTSMRYQPSEKEQEGTGWDEDWNEF